jgi:hypothetical protein
MMRRLPLETAIQNPNLAITKTEKFFQLLYGSKMRMFPKRNKKRLYGDDIYDTERQWVFVGGKERMISIASQSTLFAVISDPEIDTTYYTPNGYYRRDQRLTESLRWLNAFTIDIDTKDESILDILERVGNAGLPEPTAIIKTPSGGYHVSFFFSQPVRATLRAIRLYTAILRHIAEDVGADTAAVGANRIFRTPSDETLIHFSAKTYDFDWFKTWREMNHPYEPYTYDNVNFIRADIMADPALQHLLYSPCPIGQRDETCFTLVLAMKASDWPIERAKDAICEWYQRCIKGGKDPFSLRDALYKVDYVYRRPQLVAPSAKMIRKLSGMSFSYSYKKVWDTAKPREERIRSHYSEWIDDFLTILKVEPILSGKQADLAARICCPLSSFKIILRILENEGIIEVQTTKGRNGKTVISLVKKEEPKYTFTKVYYADFHQKKLIRVEIIKTILDKHILDRFLQRPPPI